MENLRKLTDHELDMRLEHAREQAALAPHMPLQEGFIFQSDRDYLQTKWQADVRAYEAERQRRGKNGNILLVICVVTIGLWLISLVICLATDSYRVFTGILYGGLGVALAVWGVAWLVSDERWWNQR